MAITLRTTGGTSTVAAGTRTNTTVNKPPNAATGDLIVVGMECGGTTLVQPTDGTGTWTLLQRVTYQDNDPWYVDLALWAKPYDGSSSWTFTHASHSTQAFAMALLGADLTNIADAPAVTAAGLRVSGTGLTAVAPSLTTVTANAWRLILRGSWDGNAISPPSGWVEDYDQPVIWMGHREEATPGASGTVSVSAGNSGSQFTWGIIHAAIRPATGTEGTTQQVSGSAAGSSTIAAAASAILLAAGSVAGVSTTTADATRLSVVHAAAGSVAASSGLAGAITYRAGVSGSAPGITGTTGTATSRLSVTGSAPSTSNAAASATSLLPASGATAAASDASASVNVLGGAVTHAASGTVAATANAILALGAARLAVAGTSPGSSTTTLAVTARLVASGLVAPSSATSAEVAVVAGPVVHQVSGTANATAASFGTVKLLGEHPPRIAVGPPRLNRYIAGESHPVGELNIAPPRSRYRAGEPR